MGICCGMLKGGQTLGLMHRIFEQIKCPRPRISVKKKERFAI